MCGEFLALIWQNIHEHKVADWALIWQNIHEHKVADRDTTINCGGRKVDMIL